MINEEISQLRKTVETLTGDITQFQENIQLNELISFFCLKLFCLFSIVIVTLNFVEGRGEAVLLGHFSSISKKL